MSDHTVNLTATRRSAAPLAAVTLICFLATLLPARTSRAQSVGQQTGAPAPVSAIGGGFGGTSTLGLPTPAANSTEALAAVDLSTGAATSQFPFQLPAARGDAQPSLALTYNSSNGVGFAGRGWTLNFSSITRKGASGLPRFVDEVLNDPSAGAPARTLQADPFHDDYYVDGHLLVPIIRVDDTAGGSTSGFPPAEVFPQWALSTVTATCGSSGAPESWTYFRREVDDGNRYFLSCDGRTWRVQTKTGHLLEFGHPVDGQFTDGIEVADALSVQVGSNSVVGNTSANQGTPVNPIYRWNLVRDADTFGNTVYYVWSTTPVASTSVANGVQYMTDILDTMQPGTSFPSPVFAHHTRLNWTLPTTYVLDTDGGAPAGIPVPQSPIWKAFPLYYLTGVDVTSAPWMAPASGQSETLDQVRRYHLTYLPNSVSTQMLLETIALEGECSTEIAESALPNNNVYGALPTATPTPPCPEMPSTTTPYVYFTYTPDAQVSVGGNSLTISTLSTQTLSPAAIVGRNNIAQSNPWQPSDAPHAFLDIDGNGTADLIYGALNKDHQPLDCPNGNCITDPVTGTTETGPYGEFVDYSPPGSSSPENFFLASSNPSGFTSPATPWDLAPGGARLIYGEWVPTGIPSWLVVSPAIGAQTGTTYQIWSPTIVNPVGAVNQTNNQTYTAVAGGTFAITNLLPSSWGAANALDVDGDGIPDMTQAPLAGNQGYGTYLSARSASGQVQPFARPLSVPTNQIVTPSSYPANEVPPPQILSADMDGDGLSDYVVASWLPEEGPINFTTQPFLSLYVYQNRGNGQYGNGAGGASYILGTSGVVQGGVTVNSSLSPEVLSLGDLNGDGLADLTNWNNRGFQVCLQSPGGFVCSFQQAPASQGNAQIPASLQPTEPYIDDIADVDGTGVPRILFGTPGSLVTYGVEPPQANGQPAVKGGLLKSIVAYTGLTTDLTYASAHQVATLPTPLPVPVWVVTSTTTANNVTSDVQARSVTTQYGYSNAVYDPRDKIFAGFQQVSETVNSTDPGWPGETRLTLFATTSCEISTATLVADDASINNCTQLVDYSQYRLVRGLPVAVEEFSSGGLMRTTLTQYQWDQVYQGLDGRTVTLQKPYVISRYDIDSQTTNMVSATVPAVLLAESTSPEGLAVDVPGVQVELPGSGSPVRRAMQFDVFGNITSLTDYGLVNADETVQVSVTSELPPGDATGWNYRPQQVVTSSTNPAYSRVKSYQYDSLGRLTKTFGILSGSRTLPGPSGGRPAGQPADASTDGTVLLQTISYDTRGGNPSAITMPNNRCASITYDPVFAQLPQSSTSGACGGGLSTIYIYDRGLGVLTEQSGLFQGAQTPAHITTATLDGFGRPTNLYQPNESAAGFADMTVPAVTFSYGDQLPVRTVTYTTVDGPAPGALSAQHVIFLDGFGDVMARGDQSGPQSGTTQWTLSGIHSRYANGLLKTVSKPIYTPSLLFVIGSFGSASTATTTYDGLGRPVGYTDFDLNTTKYSYQFRENGVAAAVTVLDPEQQGVRLLHPNSSTTLQYNGHGQLAATVANLASTANGPGVVTTNYAYLPTGELSSVAQTAGSNSIYSRTMTYDTLGRLVFNQEPNTSNDGTSGWTYAYDDNGDLVGTSDARGCGKNIFYDSNGRFSAEDYSPCDSAHQATYTAPNPTTGDGTESFVTYDSYNNIQTVRDRAQASFDLYDQRDRLVSTTTFLAAPGLNPPASLGQRYGVQSFIKEVTSYSEANRPIAYTTGATIAAGLWESSSPPLTGPVVTQTYTFEGAVESVSAAPYGTLLANQSFFPNGAPQQQTYGDQAQTTAVSSYCNQSAIDYCGNGELTGYSLTRSAGPWVSPIVGILDGYSNLGGVQNSLQNDLTNLSFVYDRNDNPVAITDTSTSSQWGSGALPASNRRFSYWDDYRLHDSSTTYASTSGADTQSSPYSSEIQGGSNVYPPAAPVPAGKSPLARVRDQNFSYDWRGNVTNSTDDVGLFFDRSLGSVQPVAGRPDQMSTAGLAGGPLSLANYDAAGNLSSFADATIGSVYAYYWDEVGRLSSATRTDAAELAIADEFAYDAFGQRVRTTRSDYVNLIGSPNACSLPTGSPVETSTVNVFDTLALKKATFNNGVYEDDSCTENLYIGLGGAGYAHVFYDQTGQLPKGGSNGQTHIYLAMQDSLGSTSFVVDHDTGELVEHATYQPFGAAESDYRPARWQGSREDIRHTGHWDDAEVGLSYLGARYYSPQLGRFASPDPMAIHGLAGDSNPYEYAYGAPTRYVDPFGLQDESSGSDPGGGDPGGGDPGGTSCVLCGAGGTGGDNGNGTGGATSTGVGGGNGGGAGLGMFTTFAPYNVQVQSSGLTPAPGYSSTSSAGGTSSSFDTLYGPCLEEQCTGPNPLDFAVFAASVVTVPAEIVAAAFGEGLTWLRSVLGWGKAAEGSTALATQELNVGVHAASRMAERGITEDMINAALEKGTPFIDPKNGTVNYVLQGGMASGKDLLVGTNPLTGKITTAITGSDLVVPRFLPLQPPPGPPILLGPGGP